MRFIGYSPFVILEKSVHVRRATVIQCSPHDGTGSFLMKRGRIYLNNALTASRSSLVFTNKDRLSKSCCFC